MLAMDKEQKVKNRLEMKRREMEDLKAQKQKEEEEKRRKVMELMMNYRDTNEKQFMANQAIYAELDLENEVIKEGNQVPDEQHSDERQSEDHDATQGNLETEAQTESCT